MRQWRRERLRELLADMPPLEEPEEQVEPDSPHRRYWWHLSAPYLAELERRIAVKTDAGLEWVSPGAAHALDMKYGLEVGQAESLRRILREEAEQHDRGAGAGGQRYQ